LDRRFIPTRETVIAVGKSLSIGMTNLTTGDWLFFVSSGNKEKKYPVNPVDPVKE
jgi:hypothetical protein